MQILFVIIIVSIFNVRKWRNRLGGKLRKTETNPALDGDTPAALFKIRSSSLEDMQVTLPSFRLQLYE